jgi:hypothetical protein
VAFVVWLVAFWMLLILRLIRYGFIAEVVDLIAAGKLDLEVVKARGGGAGTTSPSQASPPRRTEASSDLSISVKAHRLP